MKYEIEGEKLTAYINDDRYYMTNKEGYGLFYVDSVAGTNKQLLGTAQFSVHGLKDKAGKFRRWFKEYNE